MPTRGSCETHEEKRRKKFVGQQLVVTPKGWLLVGNFVVFVLFSTWVTHVHVQMFSEKHIFHHFTKFFIVFQPCERMRKHAFAIRNTQHLALLFLSQVNSS